MPNSPLSNRITVSAAARVLGLSPKTIYAACADGRLPAVRVAGRWVVLSNSLAPVSTLGSRLSAQSFQRIKSQKLGA